ncbi:MAG TPA: hypothetical protein VGI10_26915 [Polyangiaceae bacterium]
MSVRRRIRRRGDLVRLDDTEACAGPPAGITVVRMPDGTIVLGVDDVGHVLDPDRARAIGLALVAAAGVRGLVS